MKLVAILQARMSSTRLPGKVLMPIGAYPALYHVVKRAQAAGYPVVLAIPYYDRPLVDFAKDHGVPFYQGPLNDVLARYAEAAEAYEADIIVRITGDCPLVDPVIVQQVVQHVEDGVPFASNVWPWRSYPQGLDVEAFTIDLLRQAHREATSLYDREHVCPFMHGIASKVECVRQAKDLSHHRWTLDTPADYQFFQTLAAWLSFEPPHPTTAEVLALLEREPELLAINQETAHYPR